MLYVKKNMYTSRSGISDTKPEAEREIVSLLRDCFKRYAA